MFRLYLQIELQKAKRHKSRFAVMCIGIDRMKEINEKYGEFILHYQPIVDRDGKVVKLEVLTRWLCPKHGLISPVVFIPIAEKNGLIVDIGYYGLSNSCRQMHE